MKHTLLAWCLAALGLNANAQNIDFVTPKDGDTVTSPFMLKFAVKGMDVSPAGENKPGTGHHHVLIDTDAVPENQVIAMDAQHKHFGKGQTETELTLPPGEHVLSLQFADGAHRSYGEAYRKTIRVTVK